jgi:hypothetical protein
MTAWNEHRWFKPDKLKEEIRRMKGSQRERLYRDCAHFHENLGLAIGDAKEYMPGLGRLMAAVGDLIEHLEKAST